MWAHAAISAGAARPASLACINITTGIWPHSWIFKPVGQRTIGISSGACCHFLNRCSVKEEKCCWSQKEEKWGFGNSEECRFVAISWRFILLLNWFAVLPQSSGFNVFFFFFLGGFFKSSMRNSTMTSCLSAFGQIFRCSQKPCSSPFSWQARTLKISLSQRIK